MPISLEQNEQKNEMRITPKIIIMLLLLGAAVIVAALMVKGKSDDGEIPIVSQQPLSPELSMNDVAEEVPAPPPPARLAVRQENVDAVWGQGDEESVEVYVDTQGTSVSVVEVVLTYDPEALEIMAVEDANSVLPFAVLTGKEALTNKGEIHLVRGISRSVEDGVMGFSGEGRIVSMKIKAKNAGSVRITVDQTRTRFVPSGVSESFAFSGIEDAAFTVK